MTPTTVDDEVAKRQEPHAGHKSTWQIVALEPQRRFAYRWHPFAIEPDPVRLRPGADHAGGVHPGRDVRRGAAHHRRIRFRRDPRVASQRLVRGQLRRLGDPDRPGAPLLAEKQTQNRHCERQQRRRARRSSTRSGTPIGCASSCGCATRARARHRKSRRSIPVTRQAASKHLLLLESAGLVTSSRHGRERIWTVQTEPLARASDYLTQLSRRWDAAIDRLRAFVED